MPATLDDVLRALSTVVSPDSGKDILRLNLVKGLTVQDGRAAFTVLLKDAPASFADAVAERCREAILRETGGDMQADVAVEREMIALDMHDSGSAKSVQPAGVVNFVAVASGKGGVGKSTVAVNLAGALRQKGYDVGLVDADIYGPSIPLMFGAADEKPRVDARRKIVPLERHGVKLLSMGMMVDPEKAVIWRGPMVTNAIRQFLGECDWGALDYLILDLPPGTGDIQLTIVQSLALTGAVVVSTPQPVALADARKGVAMFRNVRAPVLGLVENMAWFSPPDRPEKKYYIFGRGGAAALSKELDVPLLAALPIRERLRASGDDGTPIVFAEPEGALANLFGALADRVAREVTVRNATQPATQKVEILHTGSTRA